MSDMFYSFADANFIRETFRIVGTIIEFFNLFLQLWRRVAVKSIGERYRLEAFQFTIIHNLWIDEESDRHMHLLPRLQDLLAEAEALGFIEILAGLQRRHIMYRRAGDGEFPAVFGGKGNNRISTDLDLHLPHIRFEHP